MLYVRTGRSASTLRPVLNTQATELLGMSTRDLPDLEYLRQRLRYEPDTGKLFWLPHSMASKSWTTRYAGKEAFTSKDRHGYRQTHMDGIVLRAHRVAWALHYGAWPEFDIDHVNHDREDNRLCNLRAVTRAENRKNASLSRNNTSGVCGVYWSTDRRKWGAYITSGGLQHNLGHFASFEDAVAARRAAEGRFGFHENHGIDAVNAA